MGWDGMGFMYFMELKWDGMGWDGMSRLAEVVLKINSSQNNSMTLYDKLRTPLNHEKMIK